MAQPRSSRVLGSGTGVAMANAEDRGIIDSSTAVVRILFIIESVFLSV